MLNNIILASKSKVRKNILEKNEISCDVIPSNVDEDIIKKSLLSEKASPEIISKNLAELKANKVSLKNHEQFVLSFSLMEFILFFLKSANLSGSVLKPTTHVN